MPNAHLEHPSVFMSFGLLNDLVRIVGDVNRIAAIGLDPDLSEEVIFACLAPRDARGRITDGSFEPPNLPMQDAEAIMDFVSEHLLDFFMRRLQKTLAAAEKNKGQMEQLASLLNGTGSSASKTPSSSP